MDSEESADDSVDESRVTSEESDSVVVGSSDEERDKDEAEDVEGLERMEEDRVLEFFCFRLRLWCDRDGGRDDFDDDGYEEDMGALREVDVCFLQKASAAKRPAAVDSSTFICALFLRLWSCQTMWEILRALLLLEDSKTLTKIQRCPVGWCGLLTAASQRQN